MWGEHTFTQIEQKNVEQTTPTFISTGKNYTWLKIRDKWWFKAVEFNLTLVTFSPHVRHNGKFLFYASLLVLFLQASCSLNT